MPLDLGRLRQRIQDFDFRKLFIEELGWDKHNAGVKAALDGQFLDLKPIAEKRGFQVFECPPAANGDIPDSAGRGAIEKQVAKVAHEHIVVYTNADRTLQKWQWVRRELGKSLARREDSFAKGDTGERLAQKLQHLFVSLSEEEQLTLPGVKGSVQKAFDVDKVTKKFYDRFKTEHTSFLKFIRGIANVADSEWYASLMLNRLMFIYFIQKKGFLDGDPDYLRNRLCRIQAEHGKDKFHSFYHYFLLRLFHEGLGQPPAQRKKDLDKLLGNVPYLNGGLFDVHDLERAYPEIQIADDAFTRLFDFFDSYRWHLDERPLRADNEINPDVLGYIFEKYINQKQMGAYYTKEDITGYIARNTLIPFLFNAAEKSCPIAFRVPPSPLGGEGRGEGLPALWRLLRDDPDRFIYEPVRRGVDLPLPDDIAAGVDDVSKRGNWNKPAALGFSLPTETWREHVARRERCHELRGKLRAGEVHDINDLITYNLDICQFAEDVIDNCEGPELLRAFYRAIENVSVLDPTCGSGAFLFAALNLLEPLYEACLDRMHGFLDDLNRSGAKHHPEKFSDFHKILADVERHPNRRYFILKSIIVGNLYGVDIMEEAVEICKLRLFLKLVAQVEKAGQIEPLPDIDFNIRAGNTLIGFASLDEIKKRMEGTLGFQQEEVDRVIEEAEIVDRAFKRFRRMQTDWQMDPAEFSEAKADVRQRLTKLREELDRYLAGEYGVDAGNATKYRAWRKTHQPFHWLAEFHGIMHGGGFDLIIGNPPYVEYKEVQSKYTIRNYITGSCGNLYAFTWERCLSLGISDGRIGMIVPVASVCTEGYRPLQTLLQGHGSTVVSNFNDRPSKLFDGLEHIRLSIILEAKAKLKHRTHATTYNKWQAIERDALFHRLCFAETTALGTASAFAKAGSPAECRLLESIQSDNHCLADYVVKSGGFPLYYTRKLSHFVQILNFIPSIKDGQGRKREPSELKEIRFRTEKQRDVFLAILNSSLFYWLLTVFSDCRNLNKREVHAAPFDFERAENGTVGKLCRLAVKLMDDIQENSRVVTMNYKSHGIMKIQCTYPRESKAIIDEIDSVLAKHFGFTDAELDFIMNYDIKYRMGQDDDEDEE